MASRNFVDLIGRLGRDPEIRYTPEGVAIANLSLATTRKWKDKTSGELVEDTEWHRLVAYERDAEVIGNYLKKGSLAAFQGRLRTRKWEDKGGVDRYTTEIIVENVLLLEPKPEDAAGDPPAAKAPATAPTKTRARSGKSAAAAGDESPI